MAHRGRDLWEGALEHAGHVEEPPRARVVGTQQAHERLGVVGIPGDGSVPVRTEPIEQRRRRAGAAGERSGPQREWHCQRRRRGAVEADLPADRGQPAFGGLLGHGQVHWYNGLAQAHAQQGRRHDRRQQHDDQQRTVLVAVEHAVGQANRGEDQTDLTARDHAEADEQLVGTGASCPGGTDQLADHRHHGEHCGEPDHRRLGHRLQVGVDADLGEEHGDEQIAHRAEVARDAVVLAALCEAEAGHEGTDDEGELGGVGQFGEPECDDDRGDGDGGPRARLAMHRIEDLRHEREADDAGHDQEPNGQAEGGADRRDVDRTTRDDLDDHSENDEAQDVVGDRGTQHDASFGRGECSQVAEHTGGDADAGGGERGADEDRGVRAQAEQQPDAHTTRERCADTNHRDQQRCLAHLAELGEVHLHAHLQQQQQHTDLGEDGQ